MSADGRRQASPIVAVAIVVFGAVVALAVNLPGHLSFDSVVQLYEGRRGLYGTWHPPIMSWMLGVADAIVPGAGLFVAFDVLLAFGSLVSLLALRARPSWWAAAVAFVCVVSPQFLIYQGIVWKDVLFADTAVAGFVCLAHAANCWNDIRLRLSLIAAAFVLLTIAALARQNGAIVLPVAAVALAWIAGRNAPGHRWRNAAVYGVAGLCGAVFLGGSIALALDTRSVASPDTWGPLGQMKLLHNYDIVGAVAREPRLELPQLDDTEPELVTAIRTDGVRLYTPVRNDTLAGSAPLQTAFANSEPGELRDQWTYLVTHHLWLYLKVRADVFRWVVLTPNITACVPFAVGVAGPSDELKILGLKPRMDGRDAALTSYGRLFVHTPFFSHAAFGLVGLVLLVALLRRRRSSNIAIAAMLAAAFAFTSTFFVISIACDYRYLYFVDLSVLFAAFYSALDPSLLAYLWPQRGASAEQTPP